MAPAEQDVDFGILLALAFQEFVRHLSGGMARRGFDDLGRSAGYVFRALADEPLTIGQLAARLEVTKQAAAQIVDDTQSRGYVERRPDPRDGRARQLHLTARGRKALAAARAIHAAYERDLARRLGPAAVATLRAVLADVAHLDRDPTRPRYLHV